jgi:hypothetical protein
MDDGLGCGVDKGRRLGFVAVEGKVFGFVFGFRWLVWMRVRRGRIILDRGWCRVVGENGR